MLPGISSNRSKRVAKSALASIALLALLAAFLPLETLASGQMCTLACCAGRAPHAAGSCMDGSCDAALKRSKHNHGAKRRPVEKLCGLSIPRGLSRHIAMVPRPENAANTQSKQAKFSSSTITKPCAADCGSCVSGFVSPNYRNHAVVTRGPRQRTGQALSPANATLPSPLTLDASVRQSAPRGPPNTFF